MRFQELERIEDVVEPSNQRETRIKHFIDWAKKRIGLDEQQLNIVFSYDQKDAQEEHRTGAWDYKNNHMIVYVGNRNMVDILRTVCHELVHVKQGQIGKIQKAKVHGPGSPLEVEADAKAGYLMKLYGKLHRDIFEDTVNRNPISKQWQVRDDDAMNLKYETPKAILKNVSVKIDYDSFEAGKKVFAYLTGDRVKDFDPTNYESFSIHFKRDIDEPFYAADTKQPITNCDYVVFKDDGSVIGYQKN